MTHKKEFEGMHPYEDRMTTYVFAGTQVFDDEQFPLYTSDNGNGTTVSLETIIKRNQADPNIRKDSGVSD